MAETLYSRAAPLLEAEVDGEIVGLDRHQGEVFGFNAVASDVWRLLEQPRSLSDLCREIEQRYQVSPAQCGEEVATLLDEMIAMKLVRESGPADPSADDNGC